MVSASTMLLPWPSLFINMVNHVRMWMSSNSGCTESRWREVLRSDPGPPQSSKSQIKWLTDKTESSESRSWIPLLSLWDPSVVQHITVHNALFHHCKWFLVASGCSQGAPMQCDSKTCPRPIYGEMATWEKTEVRIEVQRWLMEEKWNKLPTRSPRAQILPNVDLPTPSAYKLEFPPSQRLPMVEHFVLTIIPA